jgi:hypothetical protein
MPIDNVNDITPRIQYVAQAAETAFDYPFPIFEDADLVVDVDGVTQALDTDYTVSGEGDDAGGTVTFLTAMAGDEIITIYRQMAIERTTDFAQNGPFSAASFNDDLDRLVLNQQDLNLRIGRAIRLPMIADADSADIELSPTSAWAEKYLYFDENGVPEPATAIETTVLTQSVIGETLYPRTTAEVNVGVTPTNYFYPQGNVKRYGAVGNGVASDTTAVQRAINVASNDNSSVYIPAGTYLVGTLTLDSSNITIYGDGAGSILKAATGIPANGAILLSLAGGADAVGNQAILDGIYGASVQLVRTSVTGSLVNVHIENLKFLGATNAIRGIWMTGFTRGCHLFGVYFDNCDDYGVALNGSWSFSLINVYCNGDGTNGTGIGLGIVGNGTRSSATAVNVPFICGGELTGHNHGMVWNFGQGGTIIGLTSEGNVADGIQSSSVEGATLTGCYLELNGGDNLQLGGTNGTDYAERWTITGNHFNNTSGGGNNIRLQSTRGCVIGPNNFAGTRTQHYFIVTSEAARIVENQIWVPDISSTYMTNSGDFSTSTNFVYRTDSTQYRFSAPRMTVPVEFRHGSGSSPVLGFFGVAAAAQAADISALTDNSAGSADNTIAAMPNPTDTPASADALRDDIVANLLPPIRNNFADVASQINDIRTVLRTYGLMA